MRKVKSLLKQTTTDQICSAPFLNSPESVPKVAVVHVHMSLHFFATDI